MDPDPASAAPALPANLAAALDRLARDSPAIADAVKTLVADELARANVERRAAFATCESAERALRAARAALAAVNDAPLLDPSAWTRDAAARLDAVGVGERLDAVAEYRAAHTLWRTAKERGVRPSRILGRGFLNATWDQMERSLEAKLGAGAGSGRGEASGVSGSGSGSGSGSNSDANADAEAARALMAALRATLPFALAAGEGGPDAAARAELVWSKDVGSTLRERNDKRKEAAKLRVEERERDAAEEVARLARAALQDGDGDGAEEDA